jgi:CubicO group peptidase (beta-lactamase class C family)
MCRCALVANFAGILSVYTVFALGSACAQERSAESARPPALTRDSLDARMTWEVEHGFAGVVLVARNGAVVFHKAYGQANRDKQIAMRPDTIFGIGSTPIDFTKAAILLLAERGKLRLSDPITKYLDGVPEDKKGITIELLLTGRSGLTNFHERPGDRDPDHSWIDRAEAVRRILSGKLLFEPGRGRRHSHSAFGLLAAIVEIVSGQSYQAFTREHLFQPAGMEDTGFFGDPYAEERMAIGYGLRKDGTTNAPPYWGKTSWLVLGSGGQVSTALDMWRWTRAVKGGKLLTPASVKLYAPIDDGILAGGDMYGFEILYAGNARSFMVVISNTAAPRTRPHIRKLAEDLASLVFERPLARFTLGIQLQVGDAGRVTLAGVVPDGPADRAGLRAGDVLLSAAGKPLGDQPAATLAALLQTGDAIEFVIERGGREQMVKVQPVAR